MRNFLCVFVCLLTVTSPITSYAQDTKWSFNCQIEDCRKDYWQAFALIERELNIATKWLASKGFGRPKVGKMYGRGASPNDVWLTGPHIRLQVPEHFTPVKHKGPAKEPPAARYMLSSNIIEFNVGKAYEDLHILTKVAPGHANKKPFDDLTDAERNLLRATIDTLIHELYHAVQMGEGYVNGHVDWIAEGTAAAVASKYSALRTHKTYLPDQKFDETLVLNTEDKEYARGYFFLKAGDVLDAHDSIGYLAKLFAYKKDVAGDHGLNWLDSFLRTKGKSLHDVYNEVVANYAAAESDYNKVQPTIDVTRIEQPVIKDSRVDAWASHARLVWFDIGSLKVPDHTPETGFLPLVTMDIPDGQGPKHARLIAGKKLAKDKRLDYLVDPERTSNVGVRFLTRVTNMPRNTPSEGDDEEIALRARTSIVEFAKPSCVGYGESWQIEAAIIPDDYDLRYSAKRGKVSPDGLYTAPASGDSDELFVQAYGKTGEAATSLGDIKLSKNGCPFQLISSDGYSFTYDPDSNMSLAKGPSGPEQAYFDREHIYGYDPSMGWVKMHKSVMARFGAQMSKDTGGLMDLGTKLRAKGKNLKCKPYDNTGPDPFTWGRAPFDFLKDLEYNRLSPLAKTCKPSITLSMDGPCPTRAPKCRIITILGKDSIVYNKGKQIVEIRLGDGTTHQVKRVNKRIRAPEGARLIKF